MAHDWPGNVRELRNYADRFVLGLWRGFDNSEQNEAAMTPSAGLPLADQMQAFERQVIAAELARHDGALKPTYEALQISRKGLYDKMMRLRIDYIDDDDA